MGLVFRVRLSSFFAGAAIASVAGSYVLYKDYKLAHQAVSDQVAEVYQSLEDRYEALDNRVRSLEKQKEAEIAITPIETSE
ncbi:hypothetical protein IHE45_01G070700 [Dioscorea alata]|uniref:Uncharacterized protein LOC120260484 n=2 Tax=Dioscorea TaxID=4672 RepID=A0AB40B9M9_DIOCR|nr:uncharacterized protein LOC120260484 [Dioscorea cayenensis subsp. rotundata]KAH7692494.1 hypothetical protein IHE45_01G070700 [Dioscorea alata]